MNSGPRRKENSPLRWSKTNEPVRSDGSRSGVNWARAKFKPERLGERPCRECLAQSGKVLEQHVTAGEDRREHERQRVAFADDRHLDLVEHLAGQA